MKNYLGLLALLLALGGSAFGQNPTAVTGTITDPNSIAYYPAQVTACLSPVTIRPTVGGQLVNPNIGANYCIGPVSTALNGSFSMGLHANANITPAGTTWIFTVTMLGSAPPAGTGSQTFQSSGITVSGASQDVGATLSALAPKLLAGGGVSSFSGGLIDATNPKYLLSPGHFVLDATFTSGQNTISCAQNDCNFVAARDNGTICFGTNMGLDASGESSTVQLPQGTLTVTGAQTATCSGGNSPAGCTPVGRFGCVLVWGPDDTAALNSAWNDTIAGCGQLVLPGYLMIIQSAEFNATSIPCQIANNVATALGVLGFSNTSTILTPTPNFNPASCTGGLGTACLFGSPGITVQNLQVFGAGINNTTAAWNGIHLTEAFGSASQGNSLWTNVQLLDWNANGGTTPNATPTTGLQIQSFSGATMTNVRVDTFGNPNCISSPGGPGTQNMVQLIGQYCAGSNSSGLIINGMTFSVDGIYGVSNSTPTSPAQSVLVQNGAFFNSVNDSMPYPSSNGSGGTASLSCVGAGTQCHIVNDTIVNTKTPGPVFGISCATGATVTLEGTTVSTAAANAAASDAIFIGATCKVISKGGNTITGGASGTAILLNASSALYMSDPSDVITGTITSIVPTCVMTTGGGTGPACTLVAGSTNEAGTVRMTPGTAPGTTGTTTITFAGTFTGPSGTTPSCVFDPANTGTGTWNLAADTQFQTRSTTVPVFTWNNTVALTAASTYDVDYFCRAR